MYLTTEAAGPGIKQSSSELSLLHLLSFLASSKTTIASIPQREEVDKKGKAST